MRIAYIAVKGIPIGGGIEKLTEEIGKRLVRRGHEVVVYSSRDYGTRDGFHEGMEIRTVGSIHTKSLHKLSTCFLATFDVIARNRVDIVHVHAVGPSVVAFLPRSAGIPAVVQTHGLEWKRDKWGWGGKSFFKLADYTAVHFPHKTTSVSKVQKDYYERRFGKDIVHIPTGVSNVVLREPAWILEQGLEPRRYILFAARLVEEKGAHFLIEAFRNLDTDMKLVIAGDAAYSEKYKASLKQMAGGDPRIWFPGFVSGRRLEELFSNAYLFCLPSTLEGLPIALLEAMSYGNCCVASDIPENLEAIGEHAFTFRNKSARNLEETLRRLLTQPELVEAKRASARTYVLRNYSWDSITQQMESLYFSMLKERGN